MSVSSTFKSLGQVPMSEQETPMYIWSFLCYAAQYRQRSRDRKILLPMRPTKYLQRTESFRINSEEKGARGPNHWKQKARRRRKRVKNESNPSALAVSERKAFQIIDEAQTDCSKKQRRHWKRLSEWEGGKSHETAQLLDSEMVLMPTSMTSMLSVS